MTRRAGWLWVLICALICAACTANPGLPPKENPYRSTAGQARWAERGPDDYGFVWFQSSMVGECRIAVEVRHGRAVKSSKVSGRYCGRIEALTVDDIFAKLRTDQRLADIVKVSYDRELGYPRQVRVDPFAARRQGDQVTVAIDDEYSYGILSLRRR